MSIYRPNPNSFVSRSGDPVQIIYDLTYGASGDAIFVEAGKVNIPEQINSYRDSTDMAFILGQIKAGNTSVLAANKTAPMFGDFTAQPHTALEMANMLNSARAHFDSLPVSEREKFGFSFERFAQGITVPVKPVESSADPVVVKEVTTNES